MITVCIFRRIPATDCDPKQPPIPMQSGHLFRFIPATPEGVAEAALDNQTFKALPLLKNFSGGVDGSEEIIHAQDQRGITFTL